MADANVYRFSSKEYHEKSGLYYFGRRSYDPNLQRWLNRDPIGIEGGVNLYGYVRNGPVNLIDPWGDAPTSATVGITTVESIAARYGVRLVAPWVFKALAPPAAVFLFGYNLITVSVAALEAVQSIPAPNAIYPAFGPRNAIPIAVRLLRFPVLTRGAGLLSIRTFLPDIGKGQAVLPNGAGEMASERRKGEGGFTISRKATT